MTTVTATETQDILSRIRGYLLLAVMLIVLGISPALTAAAADSPATQQQTSQSGEKTTDQNANPPPASPQVKPPVKSKPLKKDDKVFIPSEEISEDFAVSFPVDI